jgi:hypothetical protein
MSSIFYVQNDSLGERHQPRSSKPGRFEPQTMPIRLSDLQREAGLTCNQTYRQLDIDTTTRYQSWQAEPSIYAL